MTTAQVARYPHYSGWYGGPIPGPTGCLTQVEVADAGETPSTRLREEAEDPGIGTIAGLGELIADSRIFKLRHELNVEIRREEGIWVCEYPPLRLMGYGETIQQAMIQFMEDFASSYDGLAHEPDEALTGDAQDLKAEFQRLVTAVADQ